MAVYVFSLPFIGPLHIVCGLVPRKGGGAFGGNIPQFQLLSPNLWFPERIQPPQLRTKSNIQTAKQAWCPSLSFKQTGYWPLTRARHTSIEGPCQEEERFQFSFWIKT